MEVATGNERRLAVDRRYVRREVQLQRERRPQMVIVASTDTMFKFTFKNWCSVSLIKLKLSLIKFKLSYIVIFYLNITLLSALTSRPH